ncbi:MAG: hypothetical protein ACRD3T_18190 [Terriglobia bacterium]
MRADSGEVSWDQHKGKWMVRIRIGEEVIHRFFNLPHEADEPTLRSVANKAMEDEGFESNVTPVTIQR